MTNVYPTNRRILSAVLCVYALGVLGFPSAAFSQIFVSGGDATILDGTSTIGKYNLDGTAVDAALITYGLDGPIGLLEQL
jgi:hypothetical protein